MMLSYQRSQRKRSFNYKEILLINITDRFFPGDDVVFTCSVSNSTLLIWDYYGQTETYLAGSPSERILGGFNLTLVSTMNGVIRSEASLQHVTSNDNGRNINCTDVSVIRHQAKVIVASKLLCYNII